MTDLQVGDVALDLAQDNPHRDPDVLETLYVQEHLSSREIADLLDCSKTTVLKWLNNHDIEKHPYDDPELLRELYHERGLSTAEIAKRFGLTAAGIRAVMERHGVERRNVHEARQKARLKTPAPFRTNLDGYEYFESKVAGETHRVYHHRLLAVAECGYEAVRDKVVHHVNNVPWDNRYDNIEVMSRAEHTKHHHGGGSDR